MIPSARLMHNERRRQLSTNYPQALWIMHSLQRVRRHCVLSPRGAKRSTSFAASPT